MDGFVRGFECSAAWQGRVKLAEADARPGRYYVTCRDARGRTAYLVGPFTQSTYGKEAHARALGALRSAKRIAGEVFWREAPWLTYGTAWMPLYGAAPVGKLNGILEEV